MKSTYYYVLRLLVGNKYIIYEILKKRKLLTFLDGDGISELEQFLIDTIIINND